MRDHIWALLERKGEPSPWPGGREDPELPRALRPPPINSLPYQCRRRRRGQGQLPLLSSRNGDTVANSDRTTVPAGFDYLRTAEEGAEFRFNVNPIPAGFFHPNSKPFAASVRFTGRALPPAFFGGRRIRHADTVVHRRSAARVSLSGRQSETVPLELVALALESIEPILVRVGDRTEEWDVQVRLSGRQPSTGQMTITKTSDTGGLFDSELTVIPAFTFIRRCDGKRLALNVGDFTSVPELMDALVIRSRAIPWSYSLPGVLRIAGLNDSFVPGGPGGFTENGVACGHPVAPAPSCAVSISLAGSSRCLCLGSTRSFTAGGSPGGDYSWAIVSGGLKAAIVSGATSQTVTVRGNQVSDTVDDITLRVDYRTGAGSVCAAEVALTTIRVVFPADAFRAANGQSLDPRNDAFPQVSLGGKELGVLTPNHPQGTIGFFKKMELRAVVAPAGAPLPCTFTFRQLRQGRSGTILGPTFVEDEKDCPAPNWCADHPINVFGQDVTPSADGSIFMVDAPGIHFSDMDTSCDTQGQIFLNCMNFRVWVEADNQRCTDNFHWFASTWIRCDGSNFVMDPTQGRNDFGQGSRLECVMSTSPPVLKYDSLSTIRLLASKSPLDRMRGAFTVSQAWESDLMSAEDRDVLIGQLIDLLRSDISDTSFHSPAAIAIGLLGRLKAAEAVDDLIECLPIQFPRTLLSFGEAAPTTLAASALAAVGKPAIPVLIDESLSSDDLQWITAENALRLITDQQAVRRAICEALDRSTSDIATHRLADTSPRLNGSHAKRTNRRCVNAENASTLVMYPYAGR